MYPTQQVKTEPINNFAKVMQAGPLNQVVDEQGLKPRINIDHDKVKNGLGQLVLTVVKLLHELLERQAIRRIDSGYLSEEEIERLGLTLMLQAQEIERMRKEFGLNEEDLNLDLGPLGKIL
ncbi:MAG: gas vesicle protein K [Candidatus Schekmanbacteria bacterium]|nr:gas vesicle protein K [Candidatus Schekmanbacteria bacterium]